MNIGLRTRLCCSSREDDAEKPSSDGFREAFLDQRFERWVERATE
jgi:hypothetical protein